jgi:peptidoglycan/xylan/chitin deacetylase (PgdA/CDA1 family)
MGPFSRSVSILGYHRVVPERDPLAPGEVCVGEFDRQLAVLQAWFRILPLREAVARLRAGTLPPRAACVTFDDGYADNATTALPILRRRGVPATFFVASGFLGGGRMWNDTVIETVRAAKHASIDARCIGLGMLPISTADAKRSAVARLLAALKYLPMERRAAGVEMLRDNAQVRLQGGPMMSEEHVRCLHRNGMEIGAHTVNHPILAKLDQEAALAEIENSKVQLQTITGAPVTLFAYPNGKPGLDYRKEHVSMVQKLGFEAAVSSAWGVANAASDPYQLPRFTPWDKTPGKFLLRLLLNTLRTAVDRA